MFGDLIKVITKEIILAPVNIVSGVVSGVGEAVEDIGDKLM